MTRLTPQQIEAMHRLVIRETGGLDGIRDQQLLDSAIQSPFQTFDGEDIYPSLPEKAARLGYGLIQNHPFADGNKRIGILVMLTFLELNGIDVNCTDEELIRIGLDLANGSMESDQLVKWIVIHI